MSREEVKRAAIRYIENQLRDGYIDLNSLDEVEMDIIACALEQYKQNMPLPEPCKEEEE